MKRTGPVRKIGGTRAGKRYPGQSFLVNIRSKKGGRGAGKGAACRLTDSRQRIKTSWGGRGGAFTKGVSIGLAGADEATVALVAEESHPKRRINLSRIMLEKEKGLLSVHAKREARKIEKGGTT